MTLNSATWHWRNPLKSITGKSCKICGKPATCAVLTTSVLPACEDHAKRAQELGYSVIFPETTKQE